MAGMPQPGDTVDAFQIGERLHFGGMAVLYQVSRAGAGDAELIMKVPRLGQGEDPVSVVSYEVENMVLGALSGPHVPRVEAIGDLAAQPYLVMERIAGPSLKEWIGQGALPVAEVVRVGQPLAQAVHALHRQDVVHLDLKPSNVLFREGVATLGAAVLVDFGLARHTHLPDLLAEEFRRPLGSAPYMAPEQVMGVRGDPRSDIFALGVILYELATGTLPFGSPTTIGGLHERLYRAPMPPRAVNPAIPEWLQEIILRCLEVEAGARYATAAQLAFDLGHGDQVLITRRGRRLRKQGFVDRWRQRFRAAGYDPAAALPSAREIAAAPIVLVAVATQHKMPEQTAALQAAVRGIAASYGDFRIAIATVMAPTPIFGTSDPTQTAGSEHVRHLVELKYWAQALDLPGERLTYHVLEGSDAADTLLDYARTNRVDQIVIGGPPLMRDSTPGMPFKPLLNAVASRVALEAPCTVTVVRPRPHHA